MRVHPTLRHPIAGQFQSTGALPDLKSLAVAPHSRQVPLRIGVPPGMFEQKTEPLLPRREFLRRLLGSFCVTLLIAGGSLAAGSVGYHVFGERGWIDAFLNASMILGGMGPVDPMKTVAGKLFAACYALYSGIAFLSMAAVITAPIAHRFIHQFHLASDDDA